ncbi:hypothetical protein MKX03_019390, partial [Papaver bracteatum]
MNCFNLVVSIFFFIYLFSISNLLIIIQYTTAQSIYINHLCLGANYTAGSTFQTNLNILIPSLSSANNLGIKNNGYYNNTVGKNPDSVYGSFQCRGDLKLDACKSCVKIGTQDISANERCPNSKQAIIWYNDCKLRYSNEYYFNIMQDTPSLYLLNSNNVSNPDKFNQILGDLLNSLATNATSNNGFASGRANLTISSEVYGFVQCSTDISPSDCYQCLLGAIAQLPNCCYGKKAGRVSRPSCVFRYDLYPLFQSTITSPALLWSTNTTAPIC